MLNFADKWAAIAWMCRNQLGRRNLTDEQKTYLIGKQYEAQKLTQGTNNQYVQAKSESHQFGDFQKGKTKDIIAKEHGIGGTTVERAEQFAPCLLSLLGDLLSGQFGYLGGSMETDRDENGRFTASDQNGHLRIGTMENTSGPKWSTEIKSLFNFRPSPSSR